MKNNPVIAKYAVALFNIAMDRGSIDEVSDHLQSISAIITSTPQIMGFLLNPSIEDDKKSEVMTKTLPKNEASKITKNFIDILLKKGRIAVFCDIAEVFEEYRKSFKNEKSVAVKTALPMTDQEILNLKTAFEKKLDCTVHLDIHNDQSLIGGIVVECEGKVYDGSVSGYLNRIHTALRGE